MGKKRPLEVPTVLLSALDLRGELIFLFSLSFSSPAVEAEEVVDNGAEQEAGQSLWEPKKESDEARSEDEKEEERVAETQQAERPLDLFKAIFEDDNDDEA